MSIATCYFCLSVSCTNVKQLNQDISIQYFRKSLKIPEFEFKNSVNETYLNLNLRVRLSSIPEFEFKISTNLIHLCSKSYVSEFEFESISKLKNSKNKFQPTIESFRQCFLFAKQMIGIDLEEAQQRRTMSAQCLKTVKRSNDIQNYQQIQLFLRFFIYH